MRAASQRPVEEFERFMKDTGLVRGEGMASDPGGASDAKK